MRKVILEELFEHTSVRRAYFTLALPVVLNMVVALVYNLVDTFFVAQTQNANLVAGVSLGAPLFTLMVALGDILGLGGSSVISRLFGEKRFDQARRVSGYCFSAGFLLGLIVLVLLFLLQTPVLKLLGATSATWEYARQYYLVIAAGAPFIVFFYAPVNILRTEGLAVESMKASVIGTVINIVLNPFFIFTCGLGAAGSALATVTGNIFADLLMIYYLRTKSQRLTTSPRETKISRRMQGEILAIGIPASVTNLMSTFAMALTNRYLIAYGPSSVAAMGISLKISMIITMVFVGFAFGAQPLIGYTYGAKDTKRFNETMRLDLTVVCGFALIMTGVIWLLAPTLIRGFMHDPTVIKHGITMIRWLVSSATLAGLILVFTTMFQSMGKALPAFILSFCRQGVIFYLVLIVFAHSFGYTGILASQAGADFITALLAVGLFNHYRPRK